MKIGILALQGDIEEHKTILNKLDAEVVEIRKPEQLEGIDGLIIPGGESTTITKLMKQYKLDSAIKKFAGTGMPIFGTCAGAIVLAKNLKGDLEKGQTSLGLIDITADRNAYGGQLESFETDLDIEGIGKFHGIFIRAPKIKANNGVVKSLAEFNGESVLVRQDNILVSTFHPELGKDLRIHKYFIDMVN
ncbi:pyridoxal 5'-phosphate synthase glutaminase subunit PdxT [Nanoarchaeota archaeon]